MTDPLHWLSMPGPDGVCWPHYCPRCWRMPQATERLRTARLPRAAGLSPPCQEANARTSRAEREDRQAQSLSPRPGLAVPGLAASLEPSPSQPRRPA